jgi:hypothetical protein
MHGKLIDNKALQRARDRHGLIFGVDGSIRYKTVF